MVIQGSIGDNFQGELLGRSGDFLIGWAKNISYPDQKVSVDLYGDNVWIATARAGLYIAEQDASWHYPLEAEGYGFVFNLAEHNVQSIARFEVKVTNHDHRLPGVVFTFSDTPQISAVVSNDIDYRGGLIVRGYAFDVSYPGHKPKIFVYEGDQLLATTVADQRHSETGSRNTKVGHHGFTLNLPITLADGNVHELRLVNEHGRLLNDSPLTICVPPSSLEGWVSGLPLPANDGDLLRAVLKRYAWHVPVSVDFSCYPAWLQRFGNAAPQCDSTASILIAITGEGDISLTLASLAAQSHSRWRALVYGSPATEADSRIKTVASADWFYELRTALDSDVDFVSFIKAGDTVSADALALLASAFSSPEIKIVYSDCDRVSADGMLCEPWFKPDWDPDLFLQTTPLHHLFATRPECLPADSVHIGEVEAWPWLAVAQVGDKPEAIHHIPYVLYHRSDASPPVHAQAKRVCDESLAPELTRDVSGDGRQISIWRDPEEWPKVTVIIPSRDHAKLLKKCIESLLNTDYPDIEIIVVDNDSVEAEAVEYLAALSGRGIGVIHYPGVFNYSAINNRAVRQATGSMIVLMNNDIEVIDIGWLKAMVRQAIRPNVGAVGAKLLWPNDMVQHAGVVLGLHGLAGHTGNDWHRDDSGYFGYNQMTRTVSAVTGACLLCKLEDYDAVGGLNETDFPVNFNDVDFCLKLRLRGKRVVWTPDARLIHAESVSRGRDNVPERRGRFQRERSRFIQRWQELIKRDPYYNQNLNLDTYSHAGLAVPPRES